MELGLVYKEVNMPDIFYQVYYMDERNIPFGDDEEYDTEEEAICEAYRLRFHRPPNERIIIRRCIADNILEL